MTNKKEIKEPPKWIDKFLEWYCSPRYIDEVQGDLHEWFSKRVEENGLRQAKYYYFLDVISYIRIFRLKNLKEMEGRNNRLFINYLVVALRQFKKNFWYLSFNAFGLTIALLSTLLISVYILDELSFDRFHQDYKTTYRLVNHSPKQGMKWASTPSPWKEHMTNEVPEITDHTRLGQDNILVQEESQNVFEDGFYWADENFTTFFDYQILSGNRERMLVEPNSVVITKSKALQYFDRVEVLGEMLPIKVYDGDKEFLMQVTGVIEDVPANSHLQFDFLGSMSSTEEMYGRFKTWWGLNWLHSYVKIPEDVDLANIKAKVPEMFEKHRGEGSSEYSDIIFQPLKEVRLYSNDVEGPIQKGNLDYLLLFGFVAVLILVAAVINYVNLTTAKSNQRGKEVSIRKVFGAKSGQISRQFYVECAFQLVLAIGLSYGIAIFILPTFNALVLKSLSTSRFFSLEVSLVMITLSVVILSFSGFYPAVLMNRFKPNDILRGVNQKVFGSNSAMRNGQVLVQFVIAAFLIGSTVVVLSQMQFLSKFDKGFSDEQLINIPVDDRGMQSQLMVIKQQLSEIPGIEAITTSGEALPSAMNNTSSFNWPEKNTDQATSIHTVAIDYDYFETLESEIVQGRNLSKQFASDSAMVCIINESAFNKTGWKDLIDKEITVDNGRRKVIGVVEDFHYNSLHQGVFPVAYFLVPPGNRTSPDNLIVRLNGERIPETINEIDKVWSSFSQQPLEFRFVDESFNQLYGDEQRFTKLVVSFSAIGIFLAVLGLLGLVSFVTAKRSKEISIRKVLGAGAGQLMAIVARQFLWIALVGIFVALPICWYVLTEWLSRFEYAVQVDWLALLISAIIATTIILLTVGGKAFKVANANPTKYLRDQ